MKTGRTLQELAIELERQVTAKKDYLANTSNMRVTAEGELVINEMVPLHITNTGHDQIAAHTDIPRKYYNRMRDDAPGLLADNVNTWFDHKPTRRMVRTLDGNARAFLSSRYRRIDNHEIAQAVLPILSDMPGVRVESCEITDNRMYIKAVNPRIETEVLKGDVVQAGIVISNSEVGLGSVNVMPMVYRLVCLNGMIAADSGMRKYHAGRENAIDVDYTILRDETVAADDRALVMKIQDIVRAASEEAKFEQIVDKMRRAADVPIVSPDIPKVVELASKDYGLVASEQAGVLDYLIRGGDLSLYGLGNACTRYSQDVESYDRATVLETTGWGIINVLPQTWQKWNEQEQRAA